MEDKMQVAYGEEYLAWYKLEGDDSIFDVLHHCGLPLEKIWSYHHNKKLKEDRKSPFWIQAPDEILAPQKEIKEKTEKSGDLYRYKTTNKHIPLIDVYLGFMDEEVNARLERLIDSQKNKDKDSRPVILIERGKLDLKSPILEWRIGNYKIEPTRIINVSPKGKTTHEKGSAQGGSEAPENILAQALTVFMEWDIKSDLDWIARGLKVKRYFDLIKLLQHRREGMKLKSGLPGSVGNEADGPWISVVRFGVGRNENAPIVVIRTPEMGLQPSLMCPYLAFLFKAISAMSSQLAHENKHKWEWPLRVSQFGAQGSSSLQKDPGSKDTILASLFVGAEIASDVSISAKEGDKQTTFKYKSSIDSETAPHWEAADAQDKDNKKGHYTKWKENEQGKYHDYQDVKNKSSLAAYAVISLCTPAGVYDFLRKPIKEWKDANELVNDYQLRDVLLGLQKRKEHQEVCRWYLFERMNQNMSDKERIEMAQTAASLIFQNCMSEKIKSKLKLVGIARDSNNHYCDYEQEIKKGMGLKEVIDKIKEKYKNVIDKGVVTLTVSYFGGDEDKDAAEKLGIEGVNMEDYHVLKVLRTAIAKGASKSSDYPLILKWRIDRINCDPKSIEKSVIDDFNNYIKEPYLTEKDYVAVIIWGLQGVLKGEIPDCAKWKFAREMEIETFQKHLWPYNSGTQDVSDPFCIEIATDFINELADIKATKEERTKDGNLGPAGGIAGIENKVSADQLKNLRNLADAVRKAWPNKVETEAKAKELMTFLKEKCQFGAGRDKLKTWLRPGKWGKDITAPTLQDLKGAKFGGAAVDRALYKSCNMMALQTYADMYFFK